jgi:flagellar protein FlaI
MAEVLASYEGIEIVRTSDSELPFYNVKELQFSPGERGIIDNPTNMMGDYKSILSRLEVFRTTKDKEDFLDHYIRDHLKDRNITPENMTKIVSLIMDKIFFGYGKIGPMMRDDNLEEIMINGLEVPVFVVHRKLGMCITNIIYNTPDEVHELIEWLSRNAGRTIDEKTPLLDGHMPDGSRANVVIAPASPKGPVITIRRFRRNPFTIIDLIEAKSLNSDLAAFLWVCIEGFGIHPCNMLIAGGSGSGKTTLMNALAMFIPQYERIVTIEDTLELNFDFLKNWVAMEASPSLIERTSGGIDMQSLVENSLRMRPDRVIIGEIRGKEAETIFVAMDIGLNGSMGTIHSNTAKETTIRLTSEPMNLPIRMFPLLDLIVVANRRYDKNVGLIRRVTEVGEIAGLEGEVVQIGQIYKLNPKTEEIGRTEYPILMTEKIAYRCRLSKQQVNFEIVKRRCVLESMIKHGIKGEAEVIKLFQEYHKNPDAVLLKLGVADMLRSQQSQ